MPATASRPTRLHFIAQPTSLTSVTLVLTLALAPSALAQSTRYFPADTEMVVQINFRQILESDLLKEKKEAVALLKLMAENALQQQSRQAHGYFKLLSFDLTRDLDVITSVGPAGADPTKVLVVVRGRFDARKFADTARKAAQEQGEAITLAHVGKHDVVAIHPPGRKETLHVALLMDQTLLLSQGKATLTDALELADSRPAELKKEVRDLLAQPDKKASFSFVATGAAVGALLEASKDPRLAPAAPLLKQLLAKVTAFNGSVTLGTDVQFQLGIAATDAATAKDFAQQANVGLFLLSQGLAAKAKEDKRLAPAIDVVKTLRASSQGNTFVLRGQVSAAVLEQALREAINRRAGAADK